MTMLDEINGQLAGGQIPGEDTPPSYSGFFSEAVPSQAFAKVGFQGEAGSGKSFSAAMFAIGLHAELRSRGLPEGNNPIAFLSTAEFGLGFLLPRFAEAGIRVVERKTRAFSQFYHAMNAAAAQRCILVVDNVSTLWDELVESYKETVGRVGPLIREDFGELKEQWRGAMDKFKEGHFHGILIGRLGWEYGRFENEATGRMDSERTNPRMKGDADTAYEVSLLVHMAKAINASNPSLPEVQRVATILKDRSTLIDGKSFINPTYNDFRPHVLSLALGGQHVAADGATSRAIITDPRSGRRWYVEKQATLDEIDASLAAGVPGMGAADKQRRADLLFRFFGTYSRERLATLHVEALRRGYAAMFTEIFGYAPVIPSTAPDWQPPAAAVAERLGEVGDIVQCPDCRGSGVAITGKASGGGGTGIRCPRCHGTGQLVVQGDGRSTRPYGTAPTAGNGEAKAPEPEPVKEREPAPTAAPEPAPAPPKRVRNRKPKPTTPVETPADKSSDTPTVAAETAEPIGPAPEPMPDSRPEPDAIPIDQAMAKPARKRGRSFNHEREARAIHDRGKANQTPADAGQNLTEPAAVQSVQVPSATEPAPPAVNSLPALPDTGPSVQPVIPDDPDKQPTTTGADALAEGLSAPEPPPIHPKRKRGRPPGSKNKPKDVPPAPASSLPAEHQQPGKPVPFVKPDNVDVTRWAGFISVAPAAARSHGITPQQFASGVSATLARQKLLQVQRDRLPKEVLSDWFDAILANQWNWQTGEYGGKVSPPQPVPEREPQPLPQPSPAAEPAEALTP